MLPAVLQLHVSKMLAGFGCASGGASNPWMRPSAQSLWAGDTHLLAVAPPTTSWVLTKSVSITCPAAEAFQAEFEDIAHEEQVARLHTLLRPHLLR